MMNLLPSVPNLVKSKIGINLHLKNNHPICIIKDAIIKYFRSLQKFESISVFDKLDPVVSTRDNFDLLRIPTDHPSRSTSDTYYIDDTTVLRTHTSCHQNDLLAKGYRSFLAIGDVYRKDEVDRYHYPVFHQMEGVHIVGSDGNTEEDLKVTLSGLIEHLFPGKEYRFSSDYFPFTEPSFEMEVKFGDRWLEILGCGTIHRDILDRHGISQNGWAFGFGLERVAMILFNIPDIRLFWTDDDRFLSQFKREGGGLVEFKPYSKLEPVDRDISFWIPAGGVQVNDGDKTFKWARLSEFYELVREICDDNIENVSLYDKFYHSKKLRYSNTFRLRFTPNSNLSDPGTLKKMADSYMGNLRNRIKDLDVELR
jgi:phenylalanyl-tRNA synthetase alpha chain